MKKKKISKNKTQQLRSEEEHEVGARVEGMGWGRKWTEDNQGWQYKHCDAMRCAVLCSRSFHGVENEICLQ